MQELREQRERVSAQSLAARKRWGISVDAETKDCLIWLRITKTENAAMVAKAERLGLNRSTLIIKAVAVYEESAP